MANVLGAYDQVVPDHTIYGWKLRAEVLARRQTEAKLRDENVQALRDLKLQRVYLVGRMKAQDDLMERVEHRTREQADFTYAVSHDLKLPANTVMMLLDMHIDENAETGVDVSQTIETRQSYDVVDLNVLCESIVSDMGEEIAASGAVVQIEAFPMLRGVEFQMRHLF